jgi:hypothetical protein
MDSYNMANSTGMYGLPGCPGAGNMVPADMVGAGNMPPAGNMIGKGTMPQAGSMAGKGTVPQAGNMAGAGAMMGTGNMMPAVSMSGGATSSPPVPSLEEIAGYNYLSAQEQQQQKQQLMQVGSRQYSGMPGGQRNTAGGGVLAPILPTTQPMAMTAESLQYMNGFLRTQIGRPVRVDFLIGTNTLVDRSGTLLAVGINYILINESDSDDIVACDFYNIKFIKFFY